MVMHLNGETVINLTASELLQFYPRVFVQVFLSYLRVMSLFSFFILSEI